MSSYKKPRSKYSLLNIKSGECWQLPSPCSLYTFTCWANMSVSLPDLLMPFSWEPVSIASGEWAASHLTSSSWPQLIATGMKETDRKRRVKSVGIERDTSEHVAPRERKRKRERERAHILIQESFPSPLLWILWMAQIHSLSQACEIICVTEKAGFHCRTIQ